MDERMLDALFNGTIDRVPDIVWRRSPRDTPGQGAEHLLVVFGTQLLLFTRGAGNRPTFWLSVGWHGFNEPSPTTTSWGDKRDSRPSGARPPEVGDEAFEDQAFLGELWPRAAALADLRKGF
jgi:hypothetical protein